MRLEPGTCAAAAAGGADARTEMLLCYREPLARLPRGLSSSARGALDTADIVQEVVAAALANLESVECRGLGSFWC